MFIMWLPQLLCRCDQTNWSTDTLRCSNLYHETCNQNHTFAVSSRCSKFQTHSKGALHNHKVGLAGAVIKTVPAAAFLRWKTNETLWGWADSPPVLQLHLSLPATYSEQECFSCMTSIKARKMNEVGLVPVLCLLHAKAAGAPKHREHLQTESNEAAGRTAAHPPCTNQSS